MAVEAHHLHLFPPQFIQNRDTMYATAQNANLCNTQMAFSITDNLIPFYNCPIADPFPAKNNNPADSGLTCYLSTPRKRPREFNSSFTEKDQLPHSFLGENFILQIQQQQSEIDRFVTSHMEKVRMDLAETRQLQRKRILAAVEEGMMKRLKEKEEEIEKIGRLNCALEERVRSLCIENQIWRNLARSNEETANALRTNLDQVLAQVNNDQTCELAEDAESCCHSNEGEENLKENDSRSCRSCRKEEACVLLLPCRHLCLCNKCSSKLNTCPVCKANKSASVHVNIS